MTEQLKEKLLETIEDLEEKSSQHDKEKAKLEVLMEQLQNEYEISSIEELEKEIKSLQAQIEKETKRIEKQMETLTTKYQDLLEDADD